QDPPVKATKPTPAATPVTKQDEAHAPTPVTVTEPAAVATPGTYPHLAALRERVASYAKAKERAEAYLAAAALLEPLGTDKMMVDALVESAEKIGLETIVTPLEAEFLAYDDMCRARHGNERR